MWFDRDGKEVSVPTTLLDLIPQIHDKTLKAELKKHLKSLEVCERILRFLKEKDRVSQLEKGRLEDSRIELWNFGALDVQR